MINNINHKKMWTTRNVHITGSPYLISVTRAFTSSDECFINLDSTCEVGSDEYIDIGELFTTKASALQHAIEISKAKKKGLLRSYENKVILCNSLLEQVEEETKVSSIKSDENSLL